MPLDAVTTATAARRAGREGGPGWRRCGCGGWVTWRHEVVGGAAGRTGRRRAGGVAVTAEAYASAEDLVARSAEAYVAGIPEHPDDDGFFGPGSVTWRLSTALRGPVAGW